MENQLLIPGDTTLVERIVNYVKAKGIFDEFRHECLADVDTKPSCQNLSQRVDGFTSKFMATHKWHSDMNKNELRNKLRRHIDESGMVTIGADHVVEQVINSKIGQLFFPRIREIVPQYLSEEKEKLNKKLFEANEEVAEKVTAEDSTKGSKSVILDPIADILAFSSSKTKPISQNVKTESPVVKNPDASKVEKKRDEKYPTQLSKSELLEKKKDDKTPQSIKVEPSEKKKEEKIFLKVDSSEKKKDEILSSLQQIKLETVEKEEKSIQLPIKDEPSDIKKEEKIELDVSENPVSVPLEKKESDDSSADKMSVSKQIKVEELEKEDSDNSKVTESSTSTDETVNKSSSTAASIKPSVISKKADKSDSSKSKQKFKISLKKSSSSASEIQKFKVAHKDARPSEKHIKHSKKLIKTSEGLLSAIKGDSSLKSAKEEEIDPKKKSNDPLSSKSVSNSVKKFTLKSSSTNKNVSNKHKTTAEKSEKQKASKTDQHDASTPGKSSQYSSSYDSSQGSDQERSFTMQKKERQKHFSKSVKKESSDKKTDPSTSGVSTEKQSKDTNDAKDFKKGKLEKLSKVGLLGMSKTTQEVGKAFSRSNSFGSTSSISSLSSASKDVSTSEESAESPVKKSKKKGKENSENKCHSNDKKFQPPPPPPPPAPSLEGGGFPSDSFPSTDEMQSSQSSQESKDSDSESLSDSSSNYEIEESTLSNQNLVCSKLNDSPSTSSTFMNDINDIFLYSSSSSEFEGFCSSPEKKKLDAGDAEDSESVSSVHTSDLSSYDNELSVDDISSDESILDEIEGKKVTLEKAQEIIERKEKEQIAAAEKEKHEVEEEYKPPSNKRKSLHLSSEEEVSSQEPKRTLRRERKLNPKYASSEYTSIFTSKIKSFITKQDTEKEVKSPKEPILNNVFSKPNQEDISSKAKMVEKSSLDLVNISPKKSAVESSEQCRALRTKNCASTSIKDVTTEKKSCKLKRKLDLDGASDSPATKRPCSRSSIDSTGSEFAANENKPFNKEKKNPNVVPSDKLNNAQKDLKETAVSAENFKKDVPYKHKMNNNGDVLNKIEPLKKNSQSKILSSSEKKASDAESNLEVTTS
ncbi:biorientation of chromosomes in cell division protein 1-like 1 [Uloborus diversus]|uniref:biorientation of chromosomes in cell division protein 1-like 1 n=1 Tax=Uloborus diversus TaxID=327109 RepID=UPI00240A4CB2|nr:biorientation of chromosomes in cell division protein 1-like 1 [Uloborus diversus]